jgi:hypothetical protein
MPVLQPAFSSLYEFDWNDTIGPVGDPVHYFAWLFSGSIEKKKGRHGCPKQPGGWNYLFIAFCRLHRCVDIYSRENVWYENRGLIMESGSEMNVVYLCR